MNLGLGLKLGGRGAVSSGGSEFLDGVLASTVCDLDTTIAASYTSGQTWTNLVSATGTAYDAFLGTDGDSAVNDPTFTGDAGTDTAYFAFDGGDWMCVCAARAF